MGTGKTSAAIKEMNEQTNKNFVFITPFLPEVARILSDCKSRRFVEPVSVKRKKNKFEDITKLLEQGRNIASTHALFRKFDAQTESLIRDGHYTLILDEVCDVIEPVNLPESDLRNYLNSGTITIGDNGRAYWHDEHYGADGSNYEAMQCIINGHAFMENDKLLLWKFPSTVFEAFDEVIVLTYLFEASALRYYFELNALSYDYIGATCVEDQKFKFCPVEQMQRRTLDIRNKIHIIEEPQLNAVGEEWNALSSSWFERENNVRDRERNKIVRLKKNAENIVRNVWDVKSGQTLWSTYGDYQKKLAGRGYVKQFLAFNYRATNDYADRTHLIYMVNIFCLVNIKNFFVTNGFNMNDDLYATSMMVQWIWRSAIRNGQEIWVYLPSRRMRTLLQDWIKEVSI